MNQNTETLINEEQIKNRIKEMAKEIATRLDDDAVVIGLLQGAFIFMADMMRALACEDKFPSTDFLWLSSYGDERESGRLNIIADLQRSVQNKQVLLIDDVYDTGKTIIFAKEYLKAKGAKEVISCLFARKPKSKDLPSPDFIGFDLPDYYLIGYGLDDAGYGRGIPQIRRIL